MNNLTITGQINKKGQYGIFNENQLDDFCKKHPEKNLIITFQVEEKKSLKGLIAYYNAKTIPSWVNGFFNLGIIKNEIEVDVYLRSRCEMTRKKSLSELTYKEMVLFHDFIKDVTLKDIHCFIEESRVL